MLLARDIRALNPACLLFRLDVIALDGRSRMGSDTLVVRNLRKTVRVPQLLMFSLAMPLAMLVLFSQVFRSVADAGAFHRVVGAGVPHQQLLRLFQLIQRPEAVLIVDPPLFGEVGGSRGPLEQPRPHARWICENRPAPAVPA